MSWPLSTNTLMAIAERIQKAHEAGRDEIIAAWCKQTGFALGVHIAGGHPFFFECVGPLSEAQADNWATNLDNVGADPVRLMM